MAVAYRSREEMIKFPTVLEEFFFLHMPYFSSHT